MVEPFANSVIAYLPAETTSLLTTISKFSTLVAYISERRDCFRLRVCFPAIPRKIVDQWEKRPDRNLNYINNLLLTLKDEITKNLEYF